MVDFAIDNFITYLSVHESLGLDGVGGGGGLNYFCLSDGYSVRESKGLNLEEETGYGWCSCPVFHTASGGGVFLYDGEENDYWTYKNAGVMTVTAHGLVMYTPWCHSSMKKLYLRVVKPRLDGLEEFYGVGLNDLQNQLLIEFEKSKETVVEQHGESDEL